MHQSELRGKFVCFSLNYSRVNKSWTRISISEANDHHVTRTEISRAEFLRDSSVWMQARCGAQLAHHLGAASLGCWRYSPTTDTSHSILLARTPVTSLSRHSIGINYSNAPKRYGERRRAADPKWGNVNEEFCVTGLRLSIDARGRGRIISTFLH